MHAGLDDGVQHHLAQAVVLGAEGVAGAGGGADILAAAALDAGVVVDPVLEGELLLAAHAQREVVVVEVLVFHQGVEIHARQGIVGGPGTAVVG